MGRVAYCRCYYLPLVGLFKIDSVHCSSNRQTAIAGAKNAIGFAFTPCLKPWMKCLSIRDWIYCEAKLQRQLARHHQDLLLQTK
jgi:hypothetical protein